MAVTRTDRLGTVLITGGAGFLGSHLVEAFIADPECGRVVATLRSSRTDQYRVAGAIYHECDITNSVEVMKLLDLENPRVVVHTVSPKSIAPAENLYRVNYRATKELIHLATQHPSVQAFVYTSSVEAVALKSGFSARPEREEESLPNSLKTGPTTYYRSKGAADAYVLQSNTPTMSSSEGSRGYLVTCSLRVPRLYGPRDNTMTPDIMKALNTIGTRVQLGPNRALHDWLYTESAGVAHVLAAKALLDSNRQQNMRVDGEAFYVTDGKPMKLWDFVRRLWAVAGDKTWSSHRRVRVLIIPWWVLLSLAFVMTWVFKILTFGTKESPLVRQQMEFMRKGCWFSIEKAEKRLNYQPVCSTDEGIRRTVEWFLSNDDWKTK